MECQTAEKDGKNEQINKMCQKLYWAQDGFICFLLSESQSQNGTKFYSFTLEEKEFQRRGEDFPLIVELTNGKIQTQISLLTPGLLLLSKFIYL